MSAHWDPQRLLQPISAEHPCGENVEDTDLLKLDAFQIFGASSLDPDPGDKAPVARQARPSDRPPNWVAVKDISLSALERSKDLRLLAFAGAALLRTDGVAPFCEVLDVASRWLQSEWARTYPLASEDVIGRRSALNCFADQAAVVDGLRRAPLAASREHGRVSLRDCEVAAGQLAPLGGDKPGPGETGRIAAAFGAVPLDQLQAQHAGVTGAAAALAAIEETMRREGGVEAAPSFEPLLGQLAKVARVLQAELAKRPEAGVAAPDTAGGAGMAAVAVGGVLTRDDALRALEAVAEFFRTTEPSSPVPMFVERAKRLVSKSFLDVLADVAPGGLTEAKSAGGVKD